MLYLRKHQLPTGIDELIIINQLEHVYGNKGGFHCNEIVNFSAIMSLKKW